jgi:hypothetical protein
MQNDRADEASDDSLEISNKIIAPDPKIFAPN